MISTTISELQKRYKSKVNRTIYASALLEGADYLINPVTGELHRVSLRHFGGAHNLKAANLQNFRFCNNGVNFPVHLLCDGVELPVWDIQKSEFYPYQLNKCQYCFSKKFRLNCCLSDHCTCHRLVINDCVYLEDFGTYAHSNYSAKEA